MAVNVATVRFRANSPKPHLVTININGKRKTKSFPTRTAAIRYQTRLNQAVNAGDEFDLVTGEPLSWKESEQRGATVCDLAVRIMNESWDGLRAKSRESLCQSLAHVIAATSPRDRRDTYAIVSKALVPNPRLTAEEDDRWRSIMETSPPAASMDYVSVHAEICSNLDGTSASASTQRRRVQALDRLFTLATGARPQKARQRGTRTRVAKRVKADEIGTLDEALSVIQCVRQLGIRRALLLMLYAGLRPSEAIALRWCNVDLVHRVITISENTPSTRSRYTDSGHQSDMQPPKWRSDGESRQVPIVEPLLILLREWREADGEEALVCRGDKGAAVHTGDLSTAWRPCRDGANASWPESRLKTPYSLRHTHASIALNAGVPIPELAERLGHSPAELLATYAAAIAADRPRWTGVMSAAFGDAGC